MQINNIMESLTFTVPLSWEAHQMADRFRQQQLDTQQAKQVYLNTLSVYAVNFYLKCMGFDPDWQSSDSFDPMMQKMTDVADLDVRNIGKFECRPVLPNEPVVLIPLESWKHRRGYFAVQLNLDLTKAEILGFVKRVTSERIPLNQLKSLDVFLQYDSQIENAVQLNQCLQNKVETGWETVESIFSAPEIAFRRLLNPPKMAWRSRDFNPVDHLTPMDSNIELERMKLINLEQTNEQIWLLVRLAHSTELEMEIGVEIYPSSSQSYLPEDLQLMILDEAEDTVMQAEAKSTQNIQLEFSGESGEAFSIKVALGDASVVETFMI